MANISVPNTFSTGTTADANQVNANFQRLVDGLNGAQDAAILEKAGITAGGTVRRGKSIIATEEVRTNVAYGTLTTPDEVANVVLPTDGVILVLFQAMWKESVNNTARASLFLGSTQVKMADPGNAAAPYGGDTVLACGTANRYKPLATNGMGLVCGANAAGSGTAYTGDVTTGQVIGSALFPTGAGSNPVGGGFCVIDADPGVYTVSVRFNSTSGSVTVKNRRLRVSTMAF